MVHLNVDEALSSRVWLVAAVLGKVGPDRPVAS